MLIYNQNSKTHLHYTYSPLSAGVQKFLLAQIRQKINQKKIISKTKIRINRKHLFQYKDRLLSIETVQSGLPISMHLFIRLYTTSQLSLVGNHRRVFLIHDNYFRSTKISIPFVYTERFLDSKFGMKYYDGTTIMITKKYLKLKLGFVGSYVDFHCKQLRKVRRFKGE